MADRQRKCLHCDVISDSFLCPEHEAEWQEKIKGFWVIDRLWYTSDRKKYGYSTKYPYWVEGHYKTKQEGKNTFFWCISAEALYDHQYNFDNALIQPY
jgi:hypothetical protein